MKKLSQKVLAAVTVLMMSTSLVNPVVVSMAQGKNSTIESVTSEWKNFRGNDENMGITDSKTPRNSEEAEVKWSVKLGTGWGNYPSSQIIVDNSVVTMASNKIYKLDKSNGKIVDQAEMAAATDVGYMPPIYADSKIIVPLRGGVIQAFDAKTLESLWVSESFDGQLISPIAYSDGHIYLGFFRGEKKDADFVCISTEDEDINSTNEIKKSTWKITKLGGFYWAGAFVKGDNVIVGGDDGTNSNDGNATVQILNKSTGEVKDSIEIVGDQRSCISYDKESDRIYFTTKAGYAYGAKVTDDGKFDKSSIVRNETSEGQCTSTPLVYNGRVYYGAGQGFGSGSIVVADATTLKTIYKVPLKGYPQSSVLLSTAYEKEEGKVYIYSTYNNKPGAITVMEDKEGQTEPKYSELMELPSELEQYCLASPICDKDGTIYYKNDSGNVIAVGKKESKVNVTFDADNGEDNIVKEVNKGQSLDYTPEAPVKDGYIFVGWYEDVDDIDTKYDKDKTYDKDVTFTAKYAHVQMVKATAKEIVNDKSGIKFETKLYTDGDTIVEKGTIILPENLLPEGEILNLKTNKIAKSVAKYIFEENESENYLTYLGTLVNIPKSQFDRKIIASSYIVYRDKNNNEYTVYAPYQTSVSVNDLTK